MLTEAILTWIEQLDNHFSTAINKGVDGSTPLLFKQVYINGLLLNI